MSEQTKRRFWQLHLSTAILTTLLIGGLMFANLRPLDSSTTKFNTTYYYYGWPFYWGALYVDDFNETKTLVYRTSFKGYESSSLKALPFIATEITVWLFLAFGPGFLSEWLIRRRGARRQ